MKALLQASASATYPHSTLAVAPVTAVIKAASRRGQARRNSASRRGIRDVSTMATPYKIQVGPQETGLLKYKQTDEGAAKLSELLQEDLEVSAKAADELLQSAVVVGGEACAGCYSDGVIQTAPSRLLQPVRLPQPRKSLGPSVPLPLRLYGCELDACNTSPAWLTLPCLSNARRACASACVQRGGVEVAAEVMPRGSAATSTPLYSMWQQC